MKKTAQQLVAEAEAEIETISVEEAFKLHGDPDVVIVDVRDVRELKREGFIPGAFHAPRGMMEFWIDPDSPYFAHLRLEEDGRTRDVFLGKATRIARGTSNTRWRTSARRARCWATSRASTSKRG